MAQNGKVGRPSLVQGWAARVRDILKSSPGLSTAEVVRRLKLCGCPVGKTALYHLVAMCRVADPGVHR